MRKVLLLLAMIVTMAAPAYAQQAEMAAIPSPEARPAPAAQAPAAATTTAPTILVDRAEIREHVRLTEEARETRQEGPNSTRWWWLVAAVAVGVVVAAILVD